MEEDGEPLPQPHAQTTCGREETGEGTHAPTAHGLVQEDRTGDGRGQEDRGDTPVRQHALPAHGMPEQGEGNPPYQEDEGAGDGPHAPLARELSPEEGGKPPARQCVLPAHGTSEREERIPLRQEAEDRAPPEQRALPAHGMQGQGGTQNHTDALRGTPEQRAPPAHLMQGRKEESGVGPQPKH